MYKFRYPLYTFHVLYFEVFSHEALLHREISSSQPERYRRWLPRLGRRVWLFIIGVWYERKGRRAGYKAFKILIFQTMATLVTLLLSWDFKYTFVDESQTSGVR
jgi:hypothetical protein